MQKLKSLAGNHFFWIVILVLSVRVIFFILSLNNMPFTGVEGFWFPDGGDAQSYYESASDIINLSFDGPVGNIGFPLFLIPFIILLSSSYITDISLVILVVNSILFFSINPASALGIVSSLNNAIAGFFG